MVSLLSADTKLLTGREEPRRAEPVLSMRCIYDFLTVALESHDEPATYLDGQKLLAELKEPTINLGLRRSLMCQ